MEQTLHAKNFWLDKFTPLACLLFWLPCFLTGQSNAGQAVSRQEEIFRALRNSGYELEDQNKLDSARYFYEKALEIAKTSENQYNLATIYTDLAIISRKDADYVSCEKYHRTALEIAQKTCDREMVEDNTHGIGYLYEIIGDYKNAVSFYIEALSLSQIRGEKEGVIVTLQNISKTYMQLNIRDLALKNIEQAKSLAVEMHNDSIMANVLHDYGEILVHFGENENALEKLQTALKTYEKVGYHRFIASSLVYLGDVYARMGKQDLTLQFFDRALKFQEAMDPYVLADLYFKLGVYEIEKKQKREARTRPNGLSGRAYFEKSLAIAESHKFKDIHLKNATRFYEMANSDGQSGEALKWLQVAADLKSEIYDVEKTKSIAEMHFKYKTAEHERTLQALELKQTRWTLIAAVAIFLIIIGFLGFIAKISARNNRVLETKNREIQHQNTALTESNNVLRQYAYVAAHDLKEPLRTICSFINLLEIKIGRKLDDPQATEYMQFISNAAKRMNVLLTDLLEYSSIFHQKPGADIIDSKLVLDEVCKNLRTLAETKKAEIIYPDVLPKLIINRIHLVQIFQNLVGNALKFTNGRPDDPFGRGRSPVVQIQAKKEGREIVFSVKDNGVGIGEQHREKIFNLFFRAHDVKDFEGTGIGLSICKSLTEKYGGRIWFQSVENQGTTFFFSFPEDILVKENEVENRLSKVA